MENNPQPEFTGKFITAQETSYAMALAEISHGKKRTHWMWFIFPQLTGLGHSITAKFYGIKNLEEAKTYLDHPVLGKRLIEIAAVLLSLKSSNATEVMGTPDDVKLLSCMTLFAAVPQADPVFEQVIDKFFNGVKDKRTLDLT